MMRQISVSLVSDCKLNGHTKSEPSQEFIHTKSEQLGLIHTFTAMCEILKNDKLIYESRETVP